jgi:hypothetical protein
MKNQNADKTEAVNRAAIIYVQVDFAGTDLELSDRR